MPENISYPVTIRIHGRLYHWLHSQLEAEREAWKLAHPGVRPKTSQFTISELARKLLEAHYDQTLVMQEKIGFSSHCGRQAPQHLPSANQGKAFLPRDPTNNSASLESLE